MYALFSGESFSFPVNYSCKGMLIYTCTLGRRLVVLVWFGFVRTIVGEVTYWAAFQWRSRAKTCHLFPDAALPPYLHFQCSHHVQFATFRNWNSQIFHLAKQKKYPKVKTTTLSDEQRAGQNSDRFWQKFRYDFMHQSIKSEMRVIVKVGAVEARHHAVPSRGWGSLSFEPFSQCISHIWRRLPAQHEMSSELTT